jgi:hypothetical protein
LSTVFGLSKCTNSSLGSRTVRVRFA